MKYRLIFSGFIFLVLVSCSKPDGLYGPVHVEGKVIDKVSKLPLANVPVQLVPYKAYKNELGFYNEEPQNNYGYISPVVTDTEGNYSIDYSSNGFSSFKVVALPETRLYIYSLSSEKFKLGSYSFNLECPRSATVKVNIQNAAPYDTVGFIAITTAFDYWTIQNAFRDTTGYVIIKGDGITQNNFRFNNGNTVNDYKNLTANPWDTIVLNYSY